MELRIEASELPGPTCVTKGETYTDVRVGVQHRKENEQLVSAAAAVATWSLPLEPVPGPDLRGPHVQGRPGVRFVYLVWSATHPDGSTGMFRRLKIPLDLTTSPLREAWASGAGCAVAVTLTGPDGTPRCGGLKTDALRWSSLADRPKTIEE